MKRVVCKECQQTVMHLPDNRHPLPPGWGIQWDVDEDEVSAICPACLPTDPDGRLPSNGRPG